MVLERMSLDDDTGEVLYRTRPSRIDHPEGPVARWDVYEDVVHRHQVGERRAGGSASRHGRRTLMRIC